MKKLVLFKKRNLMIRVLIFFLFSLSMMCSCTNHEKLIESIQILNSNKWKQNSTAAKEAAHRLIKAGPQAAVTAGLSLIRQMDTKTNTPLSFEPDEYLNKILELHGRKSYKALPLLLDALQEEHALIRVFTLTGLERYVDEGGQMNQNSNQFGKLIKLIELNLGDSNEMVADAAADAYVSISPNWEEGIIPLLQEKNPSIRIGTIIQFSSRGSQKYRNSQMFPALLPGIDDPDPNVHQAVAIGLSTFPKEMYKNKRDKMELNLLEALKNDRLRREAIPAAAKLEANSAKQAIPLLLDIYKNGDEFEKLSVGMSLSFLSPETAAKTPGVLESYIGVLNSDQPYNAMRAAECLGRMGAYSSAAIPSLTNAKRYHYSPWVKTAAKDALSLINSEKTGSHPLPTPVPRENKDINTSVDEKNADNIEVEGKIKVVLIRTGFASFETELFLITKNTAYHLTFDENCTAVGGSTVPHPKGNGSQKRIGGKYFMLNSSAEYRVTGSLIAKGVVLTKRPTKLLLVKRFYVSTGAFGKSYVENTIQQNSETVRYGTDKIEWDVPSSWNVYGIAISNVRWSSNYSQGKFSFGDSAITKTPVWASGPSNDG